jgi:hypothetical protein
MWEIELLPHRLQMSKGGYIGQHLAGLWLIELGEEYSYPCSSMKDSYGSQVRPRPNERNGFYMVCVCVCVCLFDI